VNTHGHQGPFNRYTKEESEKFLAEEKLRSEAEAAAYFAWKRGDQPRGTPPPTYIPPSPTAPASSSSHPTPASTTAGASSTGSAGVSELFDEVVAEDGGRRKMVDIDGVDVNDETEVGRERKMRAMAEELEGFNASSRREAERREEERAVESRKRGAEVLDRFGAKYEEPPTRPKR
jgi:hypothetical protein